jgi:hypothetical protein
VKTLGLILRAIAPSIATATCAVVIAAAPVESQQRPGSATAVDTGGPRPELKPPISPRRAFLYSLMFPGYAQSILGRGKTGTLLLGFEAVALVMIRESASGVREARRFLADSVPVSYVDADGNPLVRFVPTKFTSALVRTRREHVEDWIAVLVANHLFAAADGYVAALLWDLPSEVALRASPRAATLAFRVSW